MSPTNTASTPSPNGVPPVPTVPAPLHMLQLFTGNGGTFQGFHSEGWSISVVDTDRTYYGAGVRIFDGPPTVFLDACRSDASFLRAVGKVDVLHHSSTSGRAFLPSLDEWYSGIEILEPTIAIFVATDVLIERRDARTAIQDNLLGLGYQHVSFELKGGFTHCKASKVDLF